MYKDLSIELDHARLTECLDSIQRAADALNLAEIETDYAMQMPGLYQLAHSYQHMIEMIQQFKQLVQKDLNDVHLLEESLFGVDQSLSELILQQHSSLKK